MPFGVELPESFGSAPAAAPEAAPEGASKAPEGTSGGDKPESAEPKGVQDLDSLERFRFQGKELTKSELAELLAGKESAAPKYGEAEFRANFAADKAAVLANPKLLGQFARIYPDEYVEKVLAELGSRKPEAAAATPAQSTQSQDPRLDEVYQVAQEWKAQQKEARIEKIDTDLNRAFEKLGKKYPDADPEVVNSRAWALTQQGTQLYDEKGKLREDVLDKLFKADHEKRTAYYEQKYRKKVEEQKQAGFRARDVGAGGSASSAPAKEFRTIREATKAALADLEAR